MRRSDAMPQGLDVPGASDALDAPGPAPALRPVRRIDGYLPIEDYGAIGNLRTVALVGRDGSIDWCCLPALDRPSVFGGLLDHRRGGSFRVAPAGLQAAGQRYLGNSCVLETRLQGEGGVLAVTDFMPLAGDIIGACDPDTEPVVYRVLRCLDGEVQAEVEWAPRLDYARAATELRREGRYVVAHGQVDGREERVALVGLPAEAGGIERGPQGPVLRARLRLRAGEQRMLATGHVAPELRHSARSLDRVDADPGRVLRRLRDTREAWAHWQSHNEDIPPEQWAGEWSELLVRSELTLKLLTHPDTGAIAAAPTTSLPESIGGVRNWDYRFCWIRDATFTVQALYALGHSAEAHDFFQFLERAAEQGERHGRPLQIMYGLHGGTELAERELEHLEGYRGSRPVRIGNGAVAQRQHDTLGELIDGAYELALRGDLPAEDVRGLLHRIVERACDSWREPDKGIWEMRGPPRHHTFSKLMLWTALHDGVRMAERGWIRNGRVREWRRTAELLRGLILRRGYDAELGAFTQSFGSRALDAANLRIALQPEFLAADDPRMLGTIDRTMEQLMENGLVRRYRLDETDDGLPGGEGAWGICTFWLVDALALAGRVGEAREIFHDVARRASPLGLFPEQFDPATGAFLGNFPQAFTHIGLVDSLLYLRHAEGRPTPWMPRAHDADDGANAAVG